MIDFGIKHGNTLTLTKSGLWGGPNPPQKPTIEISVAFGSDFKGPALDR
jgi:hypothetical protein